MNDSEHTREVLRRLRQRWHNLKRKSLKHERISLAPRWLSDCECFMREIQKLPGYNEQLLLSGKLTLVRVSSDQFNRRTAMWLPTIIPTISGFSRFIVGTHTLKRYVIINEERFAAEELGTTYHVLRRVVDGRKYSTPVSTEWSFKHQTFTRNALAKALANNELYF